MRRCWRRTSYERIVVIGGGRGGVAAAEELRQQGFRGEVAIICDEPDAPYDRPSCSKGLLTGRQRPRDVALPVSSDLRVQWLVGRRAVELDPRAQTVYTDDGAAYAYDGLVIATGASPVTLPDWPHGEPGIHVLHGIEDAWTLRRDLRDAARVAVVGGGLTGCETASAVRSLARDCVLVDGNPQVMTRALGETVGGYITDELVRAGVSLRLGRRLREVVRRRGRWVLRLDDGSDIDADVVVATIGERPDTRWLASASDVDIADGLLCDEALRVVGMDNAVAAGTVARWPNLRYGATPARCGQWIAALEQGRAAARTLLAGDDYTPPVTLLPRWWSDQFGLRIQVAGELRPEADLLVTEMRPGRRDIARAGVLVSYVYEGRVVGVVGVNAPRAFTSVTRAMLAGQAPPDVLPVPERLAPADVAPRRRLAAVA